MPPACMLGDTGLVVYTQRKPEYGFGLPYGIQKAAVSTQQYNIKSHCVLRVPPLSENGKEKPPTKEVLLFTANFASHVYARTQKPQLTRYFFLRILQPIVSDTTALARNTPPPAAVNRSRSSKAVYGPLGGDDNGSSPRSSSSSPSANVEPSQESEQRTRQKEGRSTQRLEVDVLDVYWMRSMTQRLRPVWLVETNIQQVVHSRWAPKW